MKTKYIDTLIKLLLYFTYLLNPEDWDVAFVFPNFNLALF